MQMLYNSDSYLVVRFDVTPEGETAEAGDSGAPPAGRGGFELVDKFARKEIFIEGAVAETFRLGVEAIAAQHPEEAGNEQLGEALDAHIAGYVELAQQPVVLH